MKRHIAALIVTAGLVGACSSPNTNPAPDSGPIADAGPGIDSGVDSGPVADAGPTTDAGPADSGPVDSGPVDSGPVDSGPACSLPSDCPAGTSACIEATCSNGVCGTQNVATGIPLTMQTAGNCLSAQCDGNGNVISVNDDTNAPANTNACATTTCLNGKPVTTNAASETTCGTTGMRCDGNGTCVGCVGDGDCGTSTSCVTFSCKTGMCSSTFVPSGTSAPPQVTGDCKTNVCDGNGGVMTSLDDSDVPFSTNQCTAGTCTNGNPAMTMKADGVACDDSNACTQVDLCMAGVCTGTSPVACMAFDQCHVVGMCDPSSGLCSNPAAGDGSPCDDGNACTQMDSCQQGMCAPGSPLVCTPQDQCHAAGTCDPGSGMCSNPAASDGIVCDDGNPCTQMDLCEMGSCSGMNPVSCAPFDQCHTTGTCDPASGMCSNPAKTDGTTCDDGNPCTQSDACQGGGCGGQPIVCVAQDQCHAAGTCSVSTGACSNPERPDGSSCDDGNVCTKADVCTSGSCSGTTCEIVCGETLTAFTGSNTPGWTFNGVATYDSTANTVVLINAGQTGQRASVILEDPITVDSFGATFDFKLTTTSGRADGMMFVFQTDGNTVLGGTGSGLGALGMHGFGVELDIYNNGVCSDSNGNHAAVDVLTASCGANPVVMDSVAVSGDLYDSSASHGVGDIGDGQWRTANVQVSNGQMSVTITDPVTGGPITVPSLQNVMLPGFASGASWYFGFTAGTGGLAARHEFRNVQLTFPANQCL